MDSTATIFDPNRFSEKATNSRLTVQVKLSTDYGPASINGEIT